MKAAVQVTTDSFGRIDSIVVAFRRTDSDGNVVGKDYVSLAFKADHPVSTESVGGWDCRVYETYNPPVGYGEHDVSTDYADLDRLAEFLGKVG